MSASSSSPKGNRELPEVKPKRETTQRFRVQVPVPKTHLNLGQYVPGDSQINPGFGYPGLTLSTEAGAFVDVNERSVWQGHDTMTFQSQESLDLLANRSVNVCSMALKDWPADRPLGLYIDTTEFGRERNKQLKRHLTEYNAGIMARSVFSTVKAILSATALTSFFKGLAVVGATAGVVGASLAVAKSAKDDFEPGEGVQISSHDTVFVGSGAGQNFYAAGGFNFVGGIPIALELDKLPIPASFTVSVPMGVTLLGGLTADLFGTITASMHAGYSVDIAAIKEAGVFSRLGEAAVVGDTVKLGSKLPGKQVLKVKGNPAFQRPTRNITLSALDTVEADPVVAFKINSPLGEFSASVREVKFEAKMGMKFTCTGPKGFKLVVGLMNASISDGTGTSMVMVNAHQSLMKFADWQVVANAATLTVGGSAAKATFTPAGVKIDGPIIKLG